MIDSKILKTIHMLSLDIEKHTGYSDFELEILRRISDCDLKYVHMIMKFLTNEAETIYMLYSNPQFVLSLLDLGISSTKSGTGSFSQMTSLLLSQSLFHRDEGFYLGEEDTYTFLSRMMAIPNDKRKINYHIKRIWQSLDEQLEDYMDVSSSFIVSLINYPDYITREHFGMIPSDWFRQHIGSFNCFNETDDILTFRYPTLSGNRNSNESKIDIHQSIVEQMDEPVQYLLKLK